MSQTQLDEALFIYLNSTLNTQELKHILSLPVSSRTLKRHFYRRAGKTEEYNRRNQEVKEIRRNRSVKTADFRKKLSDIRIEAIRKNPDKNIVKSKGSWQPETAKRPKLYCDSILESKFCDFFEKEKKVFRYNRCSLRIPYKFEGLSKFYLPDFEILTTSGKKIVVEVKPTWLIKSNKKVKAKRKAALRFLKGMNIEYVITENPREVLTHARRKERP